MIQFDPTSRVTDAAEPSRQGANGAADGKGPAATEQLRADLAALSEQAAIYLAARQDQLKLGVRRAAVAVALGILALLVVAAVLVTAAATTVGGIAHGLAELFGQRLWLGELVTGIAILTLAGLVSYISVQKMLRNSRWNTINRYAELHKRQQSARRPDESKPTSRPVGG
jgi:hypothetical protein